MTSAPPRDRADSLKFARNTKTGCVHIMASPGRDGCETVLARTRMLCGVRLLTGPFPEWPAVFTAGDEFTDDDLCMGCVHALGDQQWRAFHIDSRGPS